MSHNPAPHSLQQSVSFVFPVYNEEHIIRRTISSYYEEFKGKIDFEIIVAEDGSDDATKEILLFLEKTLPIKVYLHADRKGYSRAIQDALKRAKSDWICLVDSDNQFSPKDFWKLWVYNDRYDIILGKKNNRQDGKLRAILSYGYNFLIRFLFRVPFEDIDTGFRLIKKSYSDIFSEKVSHLQFFTAEFVIRTAKVGAKIIEVPVDHFKREKGKTNIFYLRKLPRIVFFELIGLFRLFKEIKRMR